MKVAILSDIHGNRPALNTVLQNIPNSVNKIWCLGDIVGYNPWPSDCIQLIKNHADTTVQGNHDRKVAKTDQSQKTPTTPGEQNTTWTADQVSEQDKQFLANLPEQKTIHQKRAVLSHSDPRHLDSYVFPEEAENLDRYLEARPQVEVLAMGHTHIPFVEQVGGVCVVNPGSVGQPRDGDSRAGYAVVDLDRKKVELCRVEYDVGLVADRIRQVGLPDEFADRLSKGR